MTLKAVSTVGWICFALDAVLVLSMFITQNVGDDAAGRGMATGFAIVLTPILLIAGGILFWGTRSGSRAGIVGGTLFTALPFILLAAGGISNFAGGLSRKASLARRGRFADATLTRVAQAVRAGDSATVVTLLTGRTLDWTQRDPFDHTLLGVAVDAATDYTASPAQQAMVRLLLEHGVPYAEDATEPGGNWFATVVENNGDRDNDIIRAALEHGANANAKVRFDDFPLLFAMHMTPAKADLLIAHGADVNAKSKRTDRPEWTTLMNAAYMSDWPMANYFLDHSVPVRYKAPDGNDVFSVMAEVAKLSTGAAEERPPEYDALMRRLKSAKL